MTTIMTCRLHHKACPSIRNHILNICRKPKRNTHNSTTRKLQRNIFNQPQKIIPAKEISARPIHTTRVHLAAPLLGPLLVKLSKPLSRLVFLAIGRRLRKWWAALPPDQKALYIERLRKQRKFLLAAGLLTGGAMTGYYQSHIEETPITGRRRFMMLNEEQSKKLTANQSKVLEWALKEDQLSSDDINFQKVFYILKKLLSSNDLDSKDLMDRLHILVDEEANAFVLPNGHIYVNTGMLDAVSSEDELAGILGHELAHYLLSHSAEQMSRSGFFGVFSIALFTLIWAMGSGDIVAIFTSYLQNKIESILIRLPCSRIMEREADEVGLMLAARACYDVTQVPKFWERMIECEGGSRDENKDYFSTHPSHEKRIIWLNIHMPKALEIKEQVGCERIMHNFEAVAKKGFFEEYLGIRLW